MHGWYDLIGDNHFASQIQGQILNMHDGGHVELQHAIAILLEDVLYEYAYSCDCMVWAFPHKCCCCGLMHDLSGK